MNNCEGDYKIKQSGDYFSVTCQECNKPSEIEFTEYDGAMLWIKISCSCGTAGPFKLRATFGEKVKLSHE